MQKIRAVCDFQLLGDDVPQPHDVEDDAPGTGRGWQKAASAALDLQKAAARHAQAGSEPRIMRRTYAATEKHDHEP